MDSQSQYPPPNNHHMPQWARVGNLNKARYPKTFQKDQIMDWTDPATLNFNESNDLMGAEQSPLVRADYLERNIRFLQNQHQEVLSSLHAELDRLKKENKELNFKLLMNQKEPSEDYLRPIETGTAQADAIESYVQEKQRNTKVPNSAKSRNQILEQHVQELRNQVRELKNKNQYLSQLVDQKKQRSASSKLREVRIPQSSATLSEISINIESLASEPQFLPRSIVVFDHPGSSKRNPNHEELERIVVHLHKNNLHLQKELNKVKSDLKDVLYSQKWTPDAYLLAKAYIAENEHGTPDILPKLELRSNPRKLPDISYIPRDSVSLPALKNTMGTKAAERKKRTQILQKARLHKEII